MFQSILLKIASDAIEEEFLSKPMIEKIDLESQYDFLQDERACFVTLTIDGKLRGCIGSLYAHRKLIDEIISNAKHAAFEDNRFKPLSYKEFKNISIEISLLTVPQILIYETIEELQKKLRVGIDGVILQQGQHQATFLPQVWEQLPVFEEFFEHLCTKAGLNSYSLTCHPDIYTYQVEKISQKVTDEILYKREK